MSNSGNIKSLDLMSLEISPIKKPIYTKDYGTNESLKAVVKVCDKETVDSQLNKIKKVHVKSRYKTLFSNSTKNGSNSCNNSRSSPANKENIAVNPIGGTKPICVVPSTKTALRVNNRPVDRISLKSKADKPAARKIEKPMPMQEKKLSRNNNNNKEINDEKPPSGKKETAAASEEMMISDKTKYSKYQNDLDLKYAKYVQSLYLREFFSGVVTTQENNYREYLQQFNDEEDKMKSTVKVLELYQHLNKRVMDLNYANDKISEIGRDQLGCLEKVFDKLELCGNLVELDEQQQQLVVEENCLVDSVPSISEYLTVEQELVGNDVVERFSELDQKLKNVNDLVQLQSVEMKSLEDIAVSVFEKLVINARDDRHQHQSCSLG